MKKLLFTLILLPVISFSQDTLWTFSKIVKLDSISQQKIFLVANEWLTNKGLTNNKDFILESSLGKMTGVGIIPALIKGALVPRDKGIVTYYFVFLAKDGKCKLEIYNFEHHLIMANGGSLKNISPKCGTFSLSKNAWNEIKEVSIQSAKSLLESFERYMLQLIARKEDF